MKKIIVTIEEIIEGEVETTFGETYLTKQNKKRTFGYQNELKKFFQEKSVEYNRNLIENLEIMKKQNKIKDYIIETTQKTLSGERELPDDYDIYIDNKKIL